MTTETANIYTLYLRVNLYTNLYTSPTRHRAIILHSHLRYEGLAICSPAKAESSLLGIGPAQGIEPININSCVHCSQLQYSVMPSLPLLVGDLRFFASFPALQLWYIHLPLFTSTINIEYLVKYKTDLV